MKKISEIEGRNGQHMYRLLDEFTKQVAEENVVEVAFDFYVKEYELIIHRVFSANIFYKGLDYACSVYKHVVKVEYNRFCKIIIKKTNNDLLRSELLQYLRRKRNQLLKHSPHPSEITGFEIFYGVTGGFRKKYTQNRRTVEKMYHEIRLAPTIPVCYLQFFGKKLVRFLTDLKDYVFWKIRSFIWS